MQICRQREKCDESAGLGLARSARVCDCGTHVSGLELEIPRRDPIHPRSRVLAASSTAVSGHLGRSRAGGLSVSCRYGERGPARTVACDGGTLRITAQGRSRGHDRPRGREVSTLGSRNTLRLRGSCPILIVTGSDNEFSADTTQGIRTTRGRNRVVWTSELDDDATRRKHGSAEPHQKNRPQAGLSMITNKSSAGPASSPW